MTTPTTTGPPPAKQMAVCNDLRGRIASGEFPPCTQLPSVAALCVHYDVAIATMQKALDRLKMDGLLHSVQRRGIFVSDRPPHLHRIAMVYPRSPGEPGWSLFAEAMRLASEELGGYDGIEFCPYYDIRTVDEPGEAMPTLMADIQARRLRGIFCFTHASHLLGSPLTAPIDTPRVSIMSATHTSMLLAKV